MSIMSKQKTVKTKPSKPILYYDPRSPANRAVLLVAAEIGVQLDLRQVDLVTGEHKIKEFKMIEFLYKIFPNFLYPVLYDNGGHVFEYKKVCVHLADKYSTNDNLCPKDEEARNYVMSSLSFGSNEVRTQLDLECADDEVAVWNIENCYKKIELWLTEERQPFVCGEHLTIADLCCIVGLPRGHELVPIDAVKFPKLFRWFERMSALPYYEKCNGKNAKLLKSSTKSNGKGAKSVKSSTKSNGNGAKSVKTSRNLTTKTDQKK